MANTLRRWTTTGNRLGIGNILSGVRKIAVATRVEKDWVLTVLRAVNIAGGI
jgi:hypothetical protein